MATQDESQVNAQNDAEEHPSMSEELGDPELTDKQREAVKELKELIEKDGPDTSGDFLVPDEPTLLRFLRARKFSAKDAYEQYAATRKWRKTVNVKNLFENIDAEVYEQARQLYPQWTGRRDRGGRPVYIYELGQDIHQKVAALEKLAVERQMKKIEGLEIGLQPFVATSEGYMRFTCTTCSALPHPDGSTGPISLSTSIIDVAGFGITTWWGLRSHFQHIANLNSAYYPETVYRVFVVNAPYFFTKVWSWAKSWIDPGTASKIFILTGAEAKNILQKFIAPESLPKKYGGTLEWTWNQPLTFDDPFYEKFNSGKPCQLPIGPLECQLQADGQASVLSRGSVAGKTRVDKVLSSGVTS